MIKVRRPFEIGGTYFNEKNEESLAQANHIIRKAIWDMNWTGQTTMLILNSNGSIWMILYKFKEKKQYLSSTSMG